MLYKITLFLQFTTLKIFVCNGQISSNLYYSDKPLNGRCGLEITTCYKPSKFFSVVNVLVRGASESYFLTYSKSLHMSNPPRPPKDELRPVITIEEALAFCDSPQKNHPVCPAIEMVGIEEHELRKLLHFFRWVMPFSEFREELAAIKDRYNYSFLTAMDDEDFAGIRHSNLEMLADLSLLDHIIRMD